MTEREPDVMTFSGLDDLLEFLFSQYPDVRPGDTSDEAAKHLVSQAGVIGALMCMHRRGFNGEQVQDVLRRCGLSDVELEAQLEQIATEIELKDKVIDIADWRR
jgi:hypothetical protein